MDALAAGRHVRKPAAHLLHHLKLLIVGEIEDLPRVFGAVQGLFALTRNSVAIWRLMLISVNFPLSAGDPGREYVPGAAMTLRWAGQVAYL